MFRGTSIIYIFPIPLLVGIYSLRIFFLDFFQMSKIQVFTLKYSSNSDETYFEEWCLLGCYAVWLL
jgi:hypothetical protein